MGDLNKIVSLSKKEGEIERSGRQMDEFRRILDICGLRDLGFFGCPFTWSNGRMGEERIQCMLDRCVGTSSWIELFVNHEVCGSSDHCPIVVSLYGTLARKHKRRRYMKVEAMWVKEKRCEEIVQEVWKGNDRRSGVSSLFEKIWR
ncbi:hypothetical protein CFOL_v3_27650 [Cephalotus follicularis]|uniref:Exo_endo_phos domain-containing protein n=1 Tax=Cephalotus follicularis TaxID=3775 RepID=A0A1Q3CVD0_CEPFO|nr:hypothetical protein CFOL_v3_27650 [Cephalotus follicularis]